MMESLLKRIENNRKAHARWIAMVLCLSMIVSLGTFAGFRQRAVAKTYTKEVLDCPYMREGAEQVAHVHNDDCYDGDKLVCTLPEIEVHTHTEECFAELRTLTCTLAENPGHQHGDACYMAREENVCGLEENPGHVHDGTCFNESGVLICPLAEGDGAHTHTAECFTTVYDLVCEIPEGEGAHTHTDECYTTERVMTCDKPELPVHVHDAGCIRTVEWTDEEDEPIVSGQNENTVPEMPVSDPAADLETAADWEQDFEDLELSGNWAQDLVLVAATQQGRGESPNNFEAILNDAGDAWVTHNYTRYGAWYGVPYAEEWSAMFVSFCLRYAGIPEENVPNNPTAAFMAESFSKGELFAGRDYVPAVGDLIFFDTIDDEITSIDHMGIVYHVDTEDGTINTVEGDRTNAVATFGYHLDDEQIVGYGMLPQNPDYVPTEQENNNDELDNLIVTTEQITETTVPAVPMPAQSWERTAGGIKVSVEAPEGAFPENTKIAVTPVNGNSLKDTVSDAVSGEVLEVQAVDITFFDADGHEIEPAVPIRVSMTPAATEHAEEKTSVVHVDIAQQTAELIEQAAGTELDNSEVVFDADAFTIYAIVYTVDTYFRSWTGETFRVTMDFDENAGIPQNAELVVEEILEESADYSNLLSQTENALDGNKQISFVRFFDISIISDGKEVQPLAPVSMKIQLADLPEETTAADAQVIHFGNRPEVLTTEAAGANVSFETSSFSVYGVVYTVDFEYEVDGQVYYYSMEGGTSMPLSELFEILHVNNSGLSIDQFMKQIANVTFSTPSLIEIVKTENEWMLNSLQPFDTQETLTVTMADGQQFVVHVTDATKPGYTALEDVMDIEASIKGGSTIDGSGIAGTTTLRADIKFEVNNVELFNQIRTAADGEGGDKKIKLDYDLTTLLNDHETLTRLSGNGDLVGGTGTLGTYRFENGHLLIELDTEKVTDVDSAKGDLTINLQIDRTKVEESGTETFEFPGDAGSFTITWPETKHGSGSKSVDRNSDTIYPGESADEYLEYNYTLTLDGGTDLSALNLSDYLPAGMELKDGINVSCTTTSTVQTSSRVHYGQDSYGAWSSWTNGSSSSSTSTATISSPSVSDGKVTANIWQALGFNTNPDSHGTTVYYDEQNQVIEDLNHAVGRQRTVTESAYTLTYTARIKRSDALTQMGDGNSISLKNTVTWNEGTDNIPGGDATVTINKGNLTPGQKVIEPGNPSRIQATARDIVTINGIEYVEVDYAVSISEPIDASSAVLTDKLSEYQTLLNGNGAAELYVNDVKVKDTSLTANSGVITYDLQTDLRSLTPAQSFSKNTTYTLRYKTLVKKEDFGKDITNETEWTIGGVPVDGEDKTVIIEKKPYEQPYKKDTLTDNHVVGNGQWTIPWEIGTRQNQDVSNVTINDTFSDDQTVDHASFKIHVDGTEYIVPANASYLHVNDRDHSFTIDFDKALIALVPGLSAPAMKEGVNYKVTYNTTTYKYDNPSTSEQEKSENTSTWTFDGTEKQPSTDDVTLIKDEYQPGRKLVKSEEGSAAGSGWTQDGEAEVEYNTIHADDDKIDLSYTIALTEPMDGIRSAVLTDTYSNYETVDFDSMYLVVNGNRIRVPANLITRDDASHTFSVNYVAVLADQNLTLDKNVRYQLTYNTFIPLDETTRQLLLTTKTENGEDVIVGFTVENHQTWHFEGPNGPQDKPGEPAEYTFKEKPYNGGDKGVAVHDGVTGELMDITRDHNGTIVTLVDRKENTLHYTISLTEHRNASKVVLKDIYSSNQTLDEDSFTITFTDSTGTHTIQPSTGMTFGTNGFELDLTAALTAEGYSFTPEIEYVVQYDAITDAAGEGVPGPDITNDATWDFDDGNEEDGGDTEINLEIPDYLPGTKEVSVREEKGNWYKQTSDWNYWYTNGNTENLEHSDLNFRISNVVDEAPYHLDYYIKINEPRPIENAVLNDTFKGSATQTLVSGSFYLMIDNDNNWIQIPDEFVDESNPTTGFTLRLTDFLTSIGKKFEKNTDYLISFTTTTGVSGNTSGNGDGQDNRADWVLNNDVNVEGGHTEVHINMVPYLDKTYYNQNGEEKGQVDFGETVRYVITYGDNGQLLNGKQLWDSMTNYHHVDRARGVKVYKNYDKATGTGDVLAENLLSSVPNEWQFSCQDQGGNWNRNMWNDVMHICFPNLADDQSNKIEGPVTIVYYAIVGTQEQTRILGAETVMNKVRSEDVEITTDFELSAGTVQLEKTALPIEEDTLESNSRKIWWSVDVTPVEMSLQNLWLRDVDARFSKISAENAREGVSTEGMQVDTSTYELTYKNDSVNPGPDEEGGHYAGETVPHSCYRVDGNNIQFLADIREPVSVKFATRGGNYNAGSIYLYNKVRITDNDWHDVGEPDTAEKELVEEGTVTASKTFESENTVVDKDSTATIYWTIIINTTDTATVYNYTLAENKFTYSTTSIDDAKNNWNSLTFDTNTYAGVVIKDKDNNTLVKGIDYRLENGLKFLKHLQGPITVSIPMTKSNFPSGVVWLYNKAELKDPDGGSTPIEGEGQIENYTLKVDKTHGQTVPVAPNFDQIVEYTVKVNSNQDAMPEGVLTFVDVLPAGMEYYDDESFFIGFNNNNTQYARWNNTETWEKLKPKITSETLPDGRVQQTLTIDFASAETETTHFTINHQNMEVKYKARLSPSEIERLQSLGTGATQIYDNHVVVTQGDKVRGEDNSDWTYIWDNGLQKEDITDETYGENAHGANIYYKININPEGRKMNKGNELVLTDRIATSMELMLDSVKVYEIGDSGQKQDVTDIDNIRISYDGITRNLTVRVPDEQYYVVEFFGVIENAYEGLKDTFSNTAVLTGESTWRSTVTEEHEVETTSGTFSYTVPAGFLIRKIDGNKITRNLQGAEFTLYKANFPGLNNLDALYEQYANYDNDKNTVDYDLSPFVLSGQDLDPVVKYSNSQGLVTFSGLKVNELYYWMETKPPEGGYSAGLFAEPQYVIIFTKNAESDPNSEAHAVLLDHLISDANGIIVNNAVESYVWYATNTQYVQYKAEKIWQDNDDEAGLRPKSIWLQLKQNGDNFDLTETTEVNEGLVEVQADNLGDWSYTWYDLPASDENGVDYVYTAEELTPEQMLAAGLITEEQKTALEDQLKDYTTIYRKVTGGVEITNRMRDETTLLVKKAWNDENNISKIRPGFIEVKLYRETVSGEGTGTVVQMAPNNSGILVQATHSIKIYANENWQAEFTGLVTDDGSHTYRYFLVEVPVDGYDTTYVDPYVAHLTGGSAGGTAAGVADSEGIITITNTLNTARATKRWLDDQGKEVWTKDVTFKLMKRIAEGTFVDVTTPRYFRDNELEWSQTITTTTDNRTAVWNHLDALGENEAYFAIEYQIADVPENDIVRNNEGAAMSFTLNGVHYDVTGGASSSGTGTIINSPRITKTFTKEWESTIFDDDSDAASNRKNLKLQVQLIRINRADGQIDRAFNSDAEKYPEGQPITITYTTSGAVFTVGNKNVALPENPDKDETWTFTWSDLPITVWSAENDESIEYVYQVQEVKVLDAGNTDITDSFIQTQDQNDEWKYTNEYVGQDLKISKKWSPEPEGDWSITAKLQVKKRLVEQLGAEVTPGEWTGEYEDYVVGDEVQTVTIGKENGEPIAGVTFDEESGKYTRTVSLPKYLNDTANKSVYELKFTAVEGEITVDGNTTRGYSTTVETDSTTGEVTIINEKPITDIAVEKVWDGDITTGDATMVLYQVIGKKADDLEPGEVDPAVPSDKIRVTVNTILSNATNKNASIVVAYTGTNDKGAAVNGSFTLSNDAGWSNSVQLPRGGTYSFSYTPDGENITVVAPDSTDSITSTTTINLNATAVELKTYTYTFAVPDDNRPEKGSIAVTCNGITKTANADNDWTVSFEVVEENEVTYNGVGDGKFITGVTFAPVNATPVSKDQEIVMMPEVQRLTMTVPVSVTWDETATALPDDARVTVHISGNGAEYTVELPNNGSWQKSITLDRLDSNGDLIPYAVTATASTQSNKKLLLDVVPATIDSGESIAINGTVKSADPVVVTVNRINNNTVQETIGPNNFEPGSTIIITIKRNDNSGLSVTYATSDEREGNINPKNPNFTYGLVEETLELVLPNTAGAFTVNITHGWGSDAALLVSVKQKNSVGTNSINSTASTSSSIRFSAPRALMNSAPLRVTPTPSTQKTFYDATVFGTGNLPFTAVKFKDLPEGATPVTNLPKNTAGNEQSGTVQITDDESMKWENLPKIDENGNPIYYYVVEKDATAKADTMTVSYGYEYNEDGTIRKVTITNTTTGTPEPETKSISGSKIWIDDGTKTHNNGTDVSLKLIGKAGDNEAIIFTDALPTWTESGSYTFTGLPVSDGSGNAYTYSVEETGFKVGDDEYTVEKTGENYVVKKDGIEVKDYKVTQSGNEITNTELTTFEFSKIWKDLSAQPTQWPANMKIVVTMNAYTKDAPEEKALEDKELTFGLNPENLPEGWTVVTSDDNKKTTFKTTGLEPKKDGKDLVYYVVEAKITGYKDPAYETIEGGSSNTGKATNGQIIVNSPEGGYELPSTGGIGTTLFTALGGLMTATAGAILTMKSYRRRKENA